MSTASRGSWATRSVKITEIYLEDFKSRQARAQHTQFSPVGKMRVRQRGHGRHYLPARAQQQVADEKPSARTRQQTDTDE